MLEELNRKLEAIQKISNLKFEFGIFAEDAGKKVTYRTYDLEGVEVGKAEATLYEVMYLTDKGTIALPAYKLLDTIFLFIKKYIDKYFEEAIDRVMKEKNVDRAIKETFDKFETYINLYLIKEAIDHVISKYTSITRVLNDGEAEMKVIYDLNALKRCIKCKIFA